ncbi:MAG: IPT/TIG domain-containing protein [Acidobacteriia bacterium]|nr:IPT/TIG domain-containing protein [Terriglobia bacterium]
MNGKRAMRRLALCALAGVLALGATIQNGYAQQALAIDPSNPATLYAAEYGGGVFKSINGGASWTASSSGLTNLGVLALVVDPSNPATLYAGTTKGGVFRSTNGGASWSASNPGLPYDVRALAIDPWNPATLYAGIDAGSNAGGVYKSSNGGASWSASNSGLFSVAYLPVFALAIDPSNPADLYAGKYDGYGVFKSSNGGASWSASNTGLPAISSANSYVLALAIDRSNPTTLYAGTAFGYGVFKSSNGGASWSASNSGLTTAFDSQISALAIDPANPATIYAGTYLQGSSGGVSKSSNGGTSWSASNNGLTAVGVNALAIDPWNPATLYAATGAGTVFKSANGGASWQPTGVSTASSLFPSAAQASGAGFALTVNGSNFATDSIVQWNGSNRSTTFASATQLTASISASDVALAGTALITVFNPTPGGGASNAMTFTINNPAPLLSTLSPSTVMTGSSAFKLTIIGTNFVTGSVVQWNGSNRLSTFVSSTQLTASISATDVASAGAAQITVSNLAPGGGTSNALTLPINNPTPVLDSLSPSRATPGDAAFTLTVTGTNFVRVSLVQWNGTARTTSFVSGTRLTAAIPASDIVSGGAAQVAVFNPAPGGETSNVLAFAIAINVFPVLSPGGTVNGATFGAGSNAVAPGTIVAIFGTDLTDGTSCLAPSCNPTFGSNGRVNTTMTGTQVTVNGIPAPIFYSSPNQLGVEIPTELAGASATVQVTVNGQASAPQPVAMAPVSPGIFTFTSDGKGAGAFTHVDGSPVTQQNPAHAGELVILYATGLGQVTPSVPTGAMPGGVSATAAPTALTIDSITVVPDFAGLSGCCVGLNQVNVRLPANTRSATNIPVVLTIRGVASNPVTIAVQ